MQGFLTPTNDWANDNYKLSPVKHPALRNGIMESTWGLQNGRPNFRHKFYKCCRKCEICVYRKISHATM